MSNKTSRFSASCTALAMERGTSELHTLTQLHCLHEVVLMGPGLRPALSWRSHTDMDLIVCAVSSLEHAAGSL